MLSRLFYRSLTVHLKTLTLISSSSSHFPILPTPPSLKPLFFSLRPFSSKGDDGDGDGSWNFFDESTTSIFGEECRTSTLAGIADEVSKGDDPWLDEKKGDVFEGIEKESLPRVGGGDGDDGEWETAEGYKPWSLGGGDDEGGGIGRDIFGFGEVGEVGRIEGIEGFGEGLLEGDGNLKTEEQIELERREQELLATLKGPNRAFGDLIAASGITEDMLDSLILLKDVRGIKGLPPLQEIEDKAIAKMNATSSRAEIERRKQEEIANARVRQVDEKGRAYGTGRRKCSIARVWIKPGDGKFVVNDKEFDSYFPALDHRAELLRPFTVTNTLGLWDIACTVKGGGVSGQVGAIRLGISRALQNWEPGLRPYLKSAGYLTRDSRVVERKKYGRAKARKSFQWVKR